MDKGPVLRDVGFGFLFEADYQGIIPYSVPLDRTRRPRRPSENRIARRFAFQDDRGLPGDPGIEFQRVSLK
jgi:hypothetical protein